MPAKKTHTLLGDIVPSKSSFNNLDQILKEFQQTSFIELTERKKFKRINRILLGLIQDTPTPCFLLPAVIEYIDRINQSEILSESYRLATFEFWLNQFSKLSPEDNYLVRAKIIGKFFPREAYQLLFPIGMNKTFFGSHFIAAHLSPDIDTMIASFYGWMDAFGARVSAGIHHWCVPVSLPNGHISVLFETLFNPAILTQARTQPTLTVSGIDLVSRKDMLKLPMDAQIGSMSQELQTKAIIVIDKHGHYLGDWRVQDNEAVQQILFLFNTCVRWFESNLHILLIRAFAKPIVQKNDIIETIDSIFNTEIKFCEPAKEFSERQKRQLNDFLKKVLNIHKGLNATFSELWNILEELVSCGFDDLKHLLESLYDNAVFNPQGQLIENRPTIMARLEKIITRLDDSIQLIRNHIDRLDLKIQIKEKVLLEPPHFVTLKSEVEEIRSKIKQFDYLTVVIPDGDSQWFPVGIIHEKDIKQPALGTVTLRDFSNEEEVKMASYLEVISVMDHHKIALKTRIAPTVHIADVQSANVLLAEKALAINSSYSTLGMTQKDLALQSQLIDNAASDRSALRKHKRLLQVKIADHNSEKFFVHPQREYAEYLCFLYAILDDTDLLSKVTDRDVECIAELLNRMKCLANREITEIIDFDDIPRGEKFAQLATKRILQNTDMYSIYKKIYEFKEKEIEESLYNCISGKPSNFFADTKEQNGCCRVGQTKMFSSSFDTFFKHIFELRSQWLQNAKKVFSSHPQIDLHLHMISTIPSAHEVHSGKAMQYAHQDEMWLWIPETQQAEDHLINFLNSFNSSPAINCHMEVECMGPNAESLQQIFAQNLHNVPRKIDKDASKGLPIVIFRYKAGALNSRKAMISPFLPRILG